MRVTVQARQSTGSRQQSKASHRECLQQHIVESNVTRRLVLLGDAGVRLRVEVHIWSPREKFFFHVVLGNQHVPGRRWTTTRREGEEKGKRRYAACEDQQRPNVDFSRLDHFAF